MKAEDLTGQRFGKLVVVKRVLNPKNRKAFWLCRCDCGKEKEVASDKLIWGNTKSCGCFRKVMNRLSIIPRGKTSNFAHNLLIQFTRQNCLKRV